MRIPQQQNLFTKVEKMRGSLTNNLLLVVCAIFLVFSIRGQNLVPDPFFSEVKQFPNGNNSMTEVLKHWFKPTNPSPAFITTLPAPLGFTGIPNSPPLYYLMPFSGSSYISVSIYWPDDPVNPYHPRSYASTKLSDSLFAGDLIKLKSNYYSNPRRGNGVLPLQYSNNLGFVISDSLHGTTDGFINIVPDYNIDTVLQPHFEWLEIDTCVVLVRGGQYLTIGNFFDNNNTIYDSNRISPLPVCIDNISIERMQLTLTNGDTVYGCSNEPLTLEASNDCDYKWSLKSNPQNILHQGPKFEVKPTVSTTYLVYGWTDTLEVHVAVDERIGLELGPNQVLCLGDTFSLDISHLRADQILWSTGDTTPFVNITSPGWHYVSVARGNCVERDSVLVAYDSLPEGRITSHQKEDCLGADVTLKTPHQADYRYQWSNGGKSPETTTMENGTYWVQVSNYCGTVADTIVLNNEPCLCRIFIASAFSPDSPHEENRTFGPQGTCTYIQYQFKILNRWGQVVFDATTPGNKWDGNMANGKPAPPDVYSYAFFYHGYTESGSRAANTQQGTFTLIR